jgi:hypothetical protein
MSIDPQEPDEFERRVRALLEESMTRIDPRVRSRLTRARFAAVEEASGSGSLFWRTLASTSRGVLPAGALAAGALVMLLLWRDRAEERHPITQTPAVVEDVELLADGEVLELLEEWDAGFYEWAASEANAGGQRG